MVKGCSVWSCTNRSNGQAKERGVKFFRFPVDKHKRRSWIKAINRRDWQPTSNSFVCSDHFVSGWHAYDRSEVDYTPTVFHYKKKPVSPGRSNRAFRRNLSKTFEEAARRQKEREDGMLRLSMAHHDYAIVTDKTEDVKNYVNTGIQYECDPVLEENISLREENIILREKERKLTFSVEKIKENDKATRFYTGLPTFGVFLWLFNFLKIKAQDMTFWDGQNTPGDRKRPMNIEYPLSVYKVNV
ncbi:peroxynitrite isomerase THAP4-like isoform X2 [Argopecten irradians]|uniref:peroxynitrite isomerase THAP4-like isoform X2 n=1 Tax=Argopecten irradians TaxID=31199 RepID=UPI00371C3514